MLAIIFLKATLVVTTLFSLAAKAIPVNDTINSVTLDGHTYEVVEYEWSGHLYEGGPFVKKSGALEDVLAELKHDPKFNETHFLGFDYTGNVEKWKSNPESVYEILGLDSSNSPFSNLETRAEQITRTCTRVRNRGPGGGGSTPEDLLVAALSLYKLGQNCRARANTCTHFGCVASTEISICTENPTGFNIRCLDLARLVTQQMFYYLLLDRRGTNICGNHDLPPTYYYSQIRVLQTDTWLVNMRGCSNRIIQLPG